MKCPRCRKDTEKGWEYCSSCGFRLARTERRDSGFRLDNIFKRFDKQMQGMGRMFEKDFEVFDLSPMFKELRERPVEKKTRGFRITMSSGTGREPKISVKTFGDEKDEIRKEILEQLSGEKGMQIPMKRPAPDERKERERRFRFPGFTRTAEKTKPIEMMERREEKTEERKELQLPDRTEEPKTSVKRLDNKVVVEIEVPGVKSHDRIDVRELESSVEVKAIADDKAYFKILTKPSQFRLSSKKFEKGKLHLEFS